MKNIVLKNELVQAVEAQSFIKNGSVESCEGIKYDFRLSNRILRPEIQRAIDDDLSSLEAQSLLFVNPGEVVYVMTEEELEMPDDMFCQLSLKRKLSHEGIIVLGGFIIDPKYKGRLIFGLFNISSEKYTLRPGRKLVAGVFTKFDANDIIHDTETPEAIYDFPEKLEDWVKKFKPLSPEAIIHDVSELKANIKLLKNKLEKDDTWRKDFQEGLNKLQATVTEIADNLNTEVGTRISEISKIKVNMAVLRGIGIVLGGLLCGGIVTLIALFIAGILRIG